MNKENGSFLFAIIKCLKMQAATSEMFHHCPGFKWSYERSLKRILIFVFYSVIEWVLPIPSHWTSRQNIFCPASFVLYWCPDSAKHYFFFFSVEPYSLKDIQLCRVKAAKSFRLKFIAAVCTLKGIWFYITFYNAFFDFLFTMLSIILLLIHSSFSWPSVLSLTSSTV